MTEEWSKLKLAIAGESKQTLQALIPMLKDKSDKRFLAKAQKEMATWWELMEERGTRQEVPMKPQVVAWELGKRLESDAIVTSDSGTITTWWARQIKAQRDQMFSCSGNLASMACGLSYAIAAQIAFPKRQCVAFIGDGGFSMSPSELATCVKYKLPVKIVARLRFCSLAHTASAMVKLLVSSTDVLIVPALRSRR